MGGSFVPLGTPEMVIIAILFLAWFGARKLPALDRSLGKSMGEFRRAREDFERELNRALRNSDDRDQPSLDVFLATERLLQKTFRPRFDWRGRNGVVVVMMVLCLILLLIVVAR